MDSVARSTAPAGARPGQDGFSLIELLCGIAVAVILICGAMVGVAQHQAQRRVHTEQVLAMSACRNTMELLRSVDIAALPGYNNTGFDVPGQNGQAHGLDALQGDLDGLPGEITVVVATDPVTHLPMTNAWSTLYQVTTRVRWRGATRKGDFQMQCLMGERK
jgi:prepilin-type N-terminal cleavage/methylation domain-containing protein